MKHNRTQAPSSKANQAKGARPPAPPAARWWRAILAVVILAAIAATGWWLTHRAAATPEVRRTPDQNVLLITLDTMRADGLSCYGGPAATPNLDRLASLGVRYDFAHAHAVMTLVSHASILTGLYPFQHGIHDNAGFRLASNIPTLGALLRPHGMATAAFIASFALDSRFGLNAGFDVYDEKYGKSQMGAGFLMPERRGDAVVAAAATWIEQQHGRWLAWAHLFDPHAPYDPPSPFKEQYAGRPYYGEVAYTDSVLGRLLDAARDPSGRPTLVVVTGDHGEGLNDHGELTHGLFAYEATLRIPLLIAQIDHNTPSWTTSARPGTPQARGAVASVSARHIDIVPTILDALQIAVPANLPGRSLIGAPDRAPTVSYFEAMSASFNRGWAPLTGILLDREKYIDLPLPERYDLGSDAGEQMNLVGRDPARQRDLETRLRAFGETAGPDRRRACARSGTCRAAPGRRRATPKTTIPSGWSSSTRRCAARSICTSTNGPATRSRSTSRSLRRDRRWK
jgi:arylsulfatase A-like enzyme